MVFTVDTGVRPLAETGGHRPPWAVAVKDKVGKKGDNLKEYDWTSFMLGRCGGPGGASGGSGRARGRLLQYPQYGRRAARRGAKGVHANLRGQEGVKTVVCSTPTRFTARSFSAHSAHGHNRWTSSVDPTNICTCACCWPKRLAPAAVLRTLLHTAHGSMAEASRQEPRYRTTSHAKAWPLVKAWVWLTRPVHGLGRRRPPLRALHRVRWAEAPRGALNRPHRPRGASRIRPTRSRSERWCRRRGDRRRGGRRRGDRSASHSPMGARRAMRRRRCAAAFD